MKAKTNAAWVQEMFEPILSAVMSNQAHSQWKATLDARRLPAHQLRWRSQERSAKVLASVVQNVDTAIHWLNLYLVDNAISFPNTYPLDSNLSGG